MNAVHPRFFIIPILSLRRRNNKSFFSKTAHINVPESKKGGMAIEHQNTFGTYCRRRGTALPVLEQHGPFRAEGVHVDLTAAVGEDEAVLGLAHGRERRVAL